LLLPRARGDYRASFAFSSEVAKSSFCEEQLPSWWDTLAVIGEILLGMIDATTTLCALATESIQLVDSRKVLNLAAH
jgi:hypothetical protein